RVAAVPGYARLHPAQDPKRAQGALELMWRLERELAEICGLPHVSLQPSAGSHGELAGLLLTRAYHADRGEERRTVLTPDTGDGAAPAFDLEYERPKSIGRLRGFQGNFGVFVRSYAYIRSLGGDGLTEASETAVLNANYLLARLRVGRAGTRLPIAFDRRCMHEFVLSGAPAKRELGVKTLDIAKRLLDFGFHPPTIYFPLLVDE